jgi:hypothetical protein
LVNTMIEFVYFMSHSVLMMALGAWLAKRHG